jgi:hypothetical protein
MLKVTVEIWPGGSERARREIASAVIARVKNGVMADYAVRLWEVELGEVGTDQTVYSYSRWSSSVWDLVARCVVAVLSDGAESLPARRTLPEVVVRESNGVQYVRLSEIAEPARTHFQRRIECAPCPAIEHDFDPRGFAYASDWNDFLNGS